MVPAAGVGRRMGAAIPKQYLPLAGRTVLDHSLQRLLDCPEICAIALVLSPQDPWWRQSHHQGQSRIRLVEGGAERCHSVLNGLEALAGEAAPGDWVLVHDAARPCLREVDLHHLLEQTQGHPDGGLLGVPVRDTMKRCDARGCVQHSVDRDHLWHAYTPQFFPLETLYQALRQALDAGTWVTDEASAMELAGFRPLMVQGHADNLKITRAEDLALAEFYLQQQRETV